MRVGGDGESEYAEEAVEFLQEGESEKDKQKNPMSLALGAAHLRNLARRFSATSSTTPSPTTTSTDTERPKKNTERLVQDTQDFENADRHGTIQWVPTWEDYQAMSPERQRRILLPVGVQLPGWPADLDDKHLRE